jgi:RNA polymerase sigma factor (sigma-70 family)
MTARPLNAVLRALADAGPPASDADLLRRFVADRDDEAFADLVKRHGRLVWAVCRHLCNSDAEADDAFQATFLVLVRNAASVKDAGKLSAWLHGVAYKVCGKSRLAAKRRTTRELATAARERNGHAVPDSAWDRALAAVHEEVAGLPDSLRVPFVMCCLEGKGQTEAAEQLGWKLGTLSGRLTRAKNAVLERLSARGLTLGVLATVGVTCVPTEVSAKAVGLGQIGFAVPGSILQLSTGVIGMSVHKVKLLAAGVLAACGLAVSGGAGWVATADAQSAPLPAKSGQSGPGDRVKQLEAELQKARAEAAKAEADAARAAAQAAEAAALKKMTEAKKKADEELAKIEEKAAKAIKGEKGEKGEKGGPTTSTKKWDYDFVVVSEGGMTRFVKLLQEYEDKGWDYAGLTKYEVDGKMADVWVFRKPKGGQYGATWTMPSGGQYKFEPPVYTYPATAPKAKTTEPTPPTPPAPALAPTPAAPPAKVPPVPGVPPAAALPAKNKADSVEDLEAEIERLTEKLAELKKKAKSKKE